MIKVTRLDGSVHVVNADFIEFVEATPDTVISLTTGKKTLVRESVDDVIDAVIAFKAAVRLRCALMQQTREDEAHHPFNDQ